MLSVAHRLTPCAPPDAHREPPRFISLALYFNLRAATAAAFLTATLSFCLQALGVLPLFVPAPDWVAKYFNEDDRADAKMGTFVYLTTAPVFVVVIFFKHDLLHRISPSPSTFLDKVCINQTDAQLKLVGILKLGACLANSKRMLILYSDVYLQKLWTVYEVACFLVTTRTIQSIDILHVSVAPIFFFSLLFMFLTTGLSFSPVSSLIRTLLAYGVGSFMYAILCRNGHREFALARHRARNFQARDAICYDEDDRPVVEGNIYRDLYGLQ